MSQYFDINLIDDYLELGLDFKVYVNGEYLVVNDPRDLVSSKIGRGYDQDGKPVRFKFLDIDHVKVGSNVLTVKQLLDLQKPPEDTEPQQGKEGEEQEPQAGGEEDFELPPLESPEQEEKPKSAQKEKKPVEKPNLKPPTK
jgi:hypothetical protein